jgi:hypothetical protein
MLMLPAPSQETILNSLSTEQITVLRFASVRARHNSVGFSVYLSRTSQAELDQLEKRGLLERYFKGLPDGKLYIGYRATPACHQVIKKSDDLQFQSMHQGAGWINELSKQS